jgi:hypothetical protein
LTLSPGVDAEQLQADFSKRFSYTVIQFAAHVASTRKASSFTVSIFISELLSRARIFRGQTFTKSQKEMAVSGFAAMFGVNAFCQTAS